MILHSVSGSKAGLLLRQPAVLVGRDVQALEQRQRQQLPQWMQNREPPIPGGVSRATLLLPHGGDDCRLPKGREAACRELLQPGCQDVQNWPWQVAHTVRRNGAESRAGSAMVASVQGPLQLLA